MQGIKEEFDPDRKENYVSITDFVTEQNKYEVSCGKCDKVFYADKGTFENINRAVEQGLDNSFLCENCRRKREEAAYETRQTTRNCSNYLRKIADQNEYNR